MFRSRGPPSISDPCRMSLRPKLAGIQAGPGREARRLGKRLHSSGAHGHSADGGSCTWCPPHLETPSCQLPAPSSQPPGWACPEGTFPNRLISLCPQKQAPSCTPGVGVKDPHFPLSARQGLGAAQRLESSVPMRNPSRGLLPRLRPKSWAGTLPANCSFQSVLSQDPGESPARPLSGDHPIWASTGGSTHLLGLASRWSLNDGPRKGTAASL